MSAAPQIALLVASAAFVVFVACLIPVVFRAQRQVERLVVTIGEVKADLDVLVGESRELVRNVNTLVERANGHMREVDEIVSTLRQWRSRAERVVNAVGVVVEAPVFRLARNMDLFRVGVSAVLRVLAHRSRRNQARRQATEGKNNV